MENLTATEAVSAATQQVITQVLNEWHTQNKRVTGFFAKYDDAAYMNEVAPGRNRAIYLLGHLVSTNDGLIPLLGLGERLFPDYAAIFSTSPDKAVVDIPTIAELKQNWEKVNITLVNHFNNMDANDWLGRHMSVSEQDFANEPLRNKLNIIITRTTHQSYHLGQLNLLHAAK